MGTQRITAYGGGHYVKQACCISIIFIMLPPPFQLPLAWASHALTVSIKFYVSVHLFTLGDKTGKCVTFMSALSR